MSCWRVKGAAVGAGVDAGASAARVRVGAMMRIRKSGSWRRDIEFAFREMVGDCARDSLTRGARGRERVCERRCEAASGALLPMIGDQEIVKRFLIGIEW